VVQFKEAFATRACRAGWAPCGCTNLAVRTRGTHALRPDRNLGRSSPASPTSVGASGLRGRATTEWRVPTDQAKKAIDAALLVQFRDKSQDQQVFVIQVEPQKRP
jgi:hypothetical protein